MTYNIGNFSYDLSIFSRYSILYLKRSLAKQVFLLYIYWFNLIGWRWGGYFVTAKLIINAVKCGEILCKLFLRTSHVF